MIKSPESNNFVNYPFLAGLIYNTPLMIHPDKAREIEQVFQTHIRGEGIAVSTETVARPEMQALNIQEGYTAAKPYALTSNGTAIIEVLGSLTHRAGSLDALSGIQSYQRLTTQIEHAAANNAVKGIVLEMDSPGGSASGLFELGEKLLAIREHKPVWAISNEMMFSAAYAIGCSASRITLPVTAMAGSIGVIAMHMDQSKLDEKRGLTYTAVKAGKHKDDFSSHKPLNDPGLSSLQKTVDYNYDLFVQHVARGRGIDEQAVRNTEAQIYNVDDAIQLGLADDKATLEHTVEMLEETYSRSTPSSTRGTRMQTKESHKMTKLALTVPAGTSAATISAVQAALVAADIEAAVSEAEPNLEMTLENVTANHPSIAQELKQQGAVAEMNRIKSVYGLPAAGHKDLIAECMFDGKTTEAEAALKIVNAEKEQRNKIADQQISDAAELDGIASAEGDDVDVTAQQPGQPFNVEAAEQKWQSDANLQAEFDSKESYIAYAKREHKKKKA